MYIEPNTTIKLYSGIPLDNSYKNTLYFATLSAQNSYFHGGISKYTLARQSYQRVERGRMRVELLADNIYDCNYLAFQNENFGNKWFYAFITGVEYVNNTTSEITFEIDVMQTWYFDYELLDSFVEREHTNNDTIGANLVDEGLDTGEYVLGNVSQFDMGDYAIVMLTNEWWEDAPQPSTVPFIWHHDIGTMRSGTLQGVHYYQYDIDSSGLSALRTDLNVFNGEGKTSSILGIFLMPKKFITSGDTPNHWVDSVAKQYGAFEGYTPRNNKLYTFPYNFLYVSNMCGKSAVFPYEFFGSNNCSFYIVGSTTSNMELMLFPLNYKGSGNTENLDEGLPLKGFPQCSFTIDTYKAWLAQNSATQGLSALQSMGAMGAGFAGLLSETVKPMIAGGMVLGGLSSILNLVAKRMDRSVQPTQTQGNDNATVLACDRKLTYVYMNKHIRGEYARIIDNFFTMYGYATKRVKTPNIHARQRWTYTKTVGCNIKGQCPVKHLEKIISIYDNGITFWVNPSEVGNYSLANPTI